MKTSHKFGIAFGLFIAIFAYGWGIYTRHHDEAAAKALAESQAAAPPQVAIMPTEECWIVDDTAREVINILLHAKGDAKPTQAGITTKIGVETELTTSPTFYDIHVDSMSPDTQRIELQHHIWEPENYAPFASGVMKAWNLETPAASKPDDSLATALTTADAATLVSENRRISSALEEHPLDPELNEEAALLLGAFAMREASGSFFDIRVTLCRMAAHLAVARASQPEEGPNGRLANAVLLALVGRATDSLAEMAPLESAQPAWANALKLRNTYDWRILPHPDTATVLEQLEWFRAATKTVDVDFATAQLPRARSQDRADWAQIVAQGYFSVENGHVFVETSVLPLMQEYASTWAAISGKQLQQSDMIDQLNISPILDLPLKSDSGLEVLGWGDWAAFYQRHICSDLQRAVYFMGSMWCVPDSTAALVDGIKKQFSGLKYYPFLATRCVADKESYAAAMLGAETLCSTQPQIVTVENWTFVKSPNKFRVEITRIPAVRSWVRVEYPLGTIYNFSSRYNAMNPLTHESTAWWNEIRQQAPYDYFLLNDRLWNHYRDSAPPAATQEGYSAIKDYDVRAMYQVAATMQNSPDAYKQAILQMCNLDPNYYITLADGLAEQNHPEDAAAAYRIAFERATDRVMMANSCQWIVDYDFTHDRKDEAERIAKDAAGVYSSEGLKTLASLQEREGKLADAEKYFGAVAERYSDHVPLAAFYHRNATASPAYAAADAKAMKALFPKGLEPASLADLQDAPDDGVMVENESDLLRKFNLKRGDIFVAVEGYRVHNLDQYWFLLAGKDDPNFKLIVWDRGYSEVNARAPHHKFGVDISSYVRAY